MSFYLSFAFTEFHQENLNALLSLLIFRRISFIPVSFDRDDLEIFRSRLA